MKLNYKVNYNLRSYTFYIMYVYYFIKYLCMLVKIVSFFLIYALFFEICYYFMLQVIKYVISNNQIKKAKKKEELKSRREKI